MSSNAEQLAYRVHPGQGPYLALVHGFLSSAAQWRDNLDALGAYCTPVTIELWGHGDSPAPADPAAYLPDHYVLQLEQIRQQLGAERWLLCGYSIGAGLTIRYTHRHAERVLAHAFTNSASAFADEQVRSAWLRDAETRSERIRQRGVAEIERIAVHPKFAKRLPTDTYEALMADAARLSPLGVANTILHTTPNACIRDIAAHNPRPALLCHGIHEQRFLPLKDWACANMASLSVAAIDAGHAVNMENPDAFNQALCSFISQYQT